MAWQVYVWFTAISVVECFLYKMLRRSSWQDAYMLDQQVYELTSKRMSTSSFSVNFSVSQSSSWLCQLSQISESSGSRLPCCTLKGPLRLSKVQHLRHSNRIFPASSSRLSDVEGVPLSPRRNVLVLVVFCINFASLEADAAPRIAGAFWEEAVS